MTFNTEALERIKKILPINTHYSNEKEAWYVKLNNFNCTEPCCSEEKAFSSFIENLINGSLLNDLERLQMNAISEPLIHTYPTMLGYDSENLILLEQIDNWIAGLKSLKELIKTEPNFFQ